MMKIISIPFLILFLAATFGGCLIVEKRSYEITMKDAKSGTAVISFYNIRSDAIGNNEFATDINNLFDTYEGDDFVRYWEEDGIHVRDRQLYIEKKKLNGTLTFDFDDITKVENIMMDDGFYYITREKTDSISKTNGQIIYGKNYKRIMWDTGMKKLTFTMYENPDVLYRDLAPVFENRQSQK